MLFTVFLLLALSAHPCPHDSDSSDMLLHCSCGLLSHFSHAVRFDLPATDVRLQISAFDNSVARSSQLQIFALGAPAPKRRCLGSVMLSMLQLHAAFGAAPVKRPHGSSDTLQQLAEFERTGDGAPVVWFDLGEADAGAVGLQCRFWVTATSSD